MPGSTSRQNWLPGTRMLVALVVLWWVPSALLAPSRLAAADEPDVLVVKASALHVGSGRVIQDGMALIKDGRLKAVGTGLEVPEGAAFFEVEGGAITPGLIDANVRPAAAASRTTTTVIRTGYGTIRTRSGRGAEGEQSSEVVPHTRVMDTLRLDSPDFETLARDGVTTVYIAPDPSAVIGARGALLKTAGPRNARVVRPEGSVHAFIGSDPIQVGQRNSPARGRFVSLYTRRPTTRMGVTWVFRKAFHDTLRRSRGLPVGGADTPSPEASEVLFQVLDSKIDLRVQARTLADITSALRLCKEFQLPFILEEPTEAFRCIELLKSSAVPVIFGPIEVRATGSRRSSGETRNARYDTMSQLVEAGITTALSARDLRRENGLARQAMYAIRFGVAPEQALAAVTSVPARLLGIEQEVGTLEKGKSADLVVWSGQPFAATSKPVLVLVGGKIVLEETPRKEAPRDPVEPEPERTMRL